MKNQRKETVKEMMFKLNQELIILDGEDKEDHALRVLNSAIDFLKPKKVLTNLS